MLAFPYTYDPGSTVEGNPGAGRFRLNHDNPAAATAMYVSAVDAAGVDTALILNNFPANAGATFRIRSAANPKQFVLYGSHSSIIAKTGDYVTVALTVFAPKPPLPTTNKGCLLEVGLPTVTGLQYAVRTDTFKAADCRQGQVVLNAPRPHDATQLALADLDANYCNPVSLYGPQGAWLDSTNPRKGLLWFQQCDRPHNFFTFALTGTAKGDGFQVLDVRYADWTSPGGPLAGQFDNLARFNLTFAPSGDKG